MAIASLLAGKPWSHRPRTTDPTLAVITRLVSDAVSASTRAQLAPLFSATLGTNTADARIPTTLARVTADVACAYGAVTPALLAPPPSPGSDGPPDRAGSWLAVQLVRARHSRRVRRARLQASTVVVAAASELTRLPTSQADRALVELLTAAVTAVRACTHPHHGGAVTGPRCSSTKGDPRPTREIPMHGHWVGAGELHAHDLIRLDNAPVVELTAVVTGQVVQLTGWTHDEYRRGVVATYGPGDQVWRVYCPALSG